MSETRYNEETDHWEVVTKLKFSGEGVVSGLKELHGVAVAKDLVGFACEEALVQFGRELAKTGVDKNLIAEQIIARGVDKAVVGAALQLDNPQAA